MQTSNLVREKLGKDFLVVSSVDHPYLVTQPDLLVGKPGKLLAIFKPHSRELANPGRLFSRLAFARLAFPVGTYCVLGLTSEIRITYRIERASNQFDEVLELDNPRSIRSFLQKSTKENRRARELIKLKEFHYARVQVFLKATNLYARRRYRHQTSFDGFVRTLKEMPTESVYYSSIIPGEAQTMTKEYKSQFLRVGETLLTTTRIGKSVHLLNPIRTLCHSAARASFVLDNGIPYPRHTSPLISVIDRLPEGRSDSLQPIRAAAFANVLLSMPIDMEGLTRIDETVLLHLKKRKLA